MSRQELFIAAILGNPGLATLVKSLTWTLLRLHTKEPNRVLLLGNSRSRDISGRPILRVWDALQLLTSVRTLDLAWLSRDHGDPLADSYPNGLFPAATSIRLSGVMHYAFAASILYKNAQKLEHLALDNLQQVGKGCDHFLYRRANRRHDYLQSPSTWNQRIYDYGPSIPFGSAGPMQNLLGPMAGHCPNLRSLTLRKVGERDQNEFTPEFAAKDEDIYHEFATFIGLVKPTLRHLTFEQGERATRPLPPALAAGQPPRPMDEHFKYILYRQLFQQRCVRINGILYSELFHWPYLESMEIGGARLEWNDDNRTIWTSRRTVIKAVTRRHVEAMDHVGLGDPLQGIR